MKDTNSSGDGTIFIVQIIFITQKLCGAITWSWWQVLIPLWILIGLAIIYLIAGDY